MSNNQIFDFLSGLVIVILLVIFSLVPQMLLLNIDDASSHLATAQAFVRNNGLTLWENWATLPLGRPHLYPPFYHLLLAILVWLGFSPLSLLKLIAVLVVVGLAAGSWFGLKKLFGSRFAFIYLLFFTAQLSVVNLLAIATPSSIVIYLSPFLLLLVKNRRLAAAILLLTIFWYTHATFPYLVASALFLWSLLNFSYFKFVLKILFFSYLLFLPWQIHVAANLLYLRYFHSDFINKMSAPMVLDINVWLTLLFVIASVVWIMWWSKEKAATNLLFFIFLFFASFLLLFEPSRFMRGAGGWVMIIFVSYFFDQLLGSNLFKNIPAVFKTKQIILWLAIFIFVSIHYQISIDLGSRELSGQITELNTIPVGIRSLVYGEGFPGMFLNYALTQGNIALAKTIHDNTGPDDPILGLANFFMFNSYGPPIQYFIAQFFADLAQRPMANGHYPENQWVASLPLSQAKIVLVDYHQTNLFANIKNEQEKKIADDLDKNFTVIGESDRLMAFKNNSPDTFKASSVNAKTILPLWFCWAIMFLSVSYIVYQVRKISRFD